MIRGFYLGPDSPHPYMALVVRIATLGGEYELVPFVIDTGATRSCIHASDAMTFFRAPPESLDPSTWDRSVRIGGIGGRARAMELAGEFYFRHDDGKVESVSGNVLVGDITTRGLPSLLGMDILQKFDLRVSPHIITLERVAV